MEERVNKAFLNELEVLSSQEMEKEAIFGIKTLLMGARRLGSGIAGKAKAGLIKAQVGAQKAQLGVTKAIQNVAAKPSRSAGGQFAAPGKIKKFFRRSTKDISKLESSIAANTAKAKQTSQIAGAKIKGTGTSVKRTWNVEKQDTGAWFRSKRKNMKTRNAAAKAKDQKILDEALKGTPKVTKAPKIDVKYKPKTDPKATATAKKKKQPILDVVGASLVGGKSKYKTVAGGAALAGGGYMAANILGGETKKPAEQGIFFKSSELNKTASLGGTTLGALTKEANPKLKALKSIAAPVAAGAAGGYAASELSEPNPEQKMYNDGLKSFKATFPELPEPEAEKMFGQVWQQYQKNQDIQTTRAVVHGAAQAQKFGSFTEEMSKEANIAAIGKIVAKIGYGAGRMLAGGKHLGNLQKAKKLTQLQRVGMSAMKNRKLVGTGIVAAGGGYALGGRKNNA